MSNIVYLQKKELFIEILKYKVSCHKKEKYKKIKYLKNLIEPHELVNESDLKDIMINNHIPSANIFYDFDFKKYEPLKSECLILFNVHPDRNLQEIDNLVSHLLKNTYGLISFLHVLDRDENFIIIS